MDIHWESSVEIAAPVERVYAYLADFPRHGEWAQTVSRLERVKEGDARGVGAVYRTYERQGFQVDRPPRGPLPEKSDDKTVCEVRELTPNRRIAWHAYALPKMGVHADLAFAFASTNESGTRLSQTVRIHFPWLVTKMLPLMVKMNATEMERKLKEQWQGSLNNIKAILEEAPATSPAGTAVAGR